MKKFVYRSRRRLLRIALPLVMLLLTMSVFKMTGAANPALKVALKEAGDYVVLAWNDLGMHCYNPDFQDLAVLPPFNTLFAQVVQVGDPPQLVTSGVEVSYAFADNTYSVGKTNFWDYEEALFGVDLPPDVGLTGKGLAGSMDLVNASYVAEGIPLTEYSDSNPTVRQPYQLATVTVHDSNTGEELATVHPVAPVSTEMHCDNCHYDGGVGGISTGRVETNILTLHDEEHGDDYPPGHEGPLMGRRPILCAECHASNALGLPGVPGLPSLSKAIHEKHHDAVPDTLNGCYNCHPGPETQCLRDVMSTQYGMDCMDCHGGMEDVADNPNPWLNEPRCDDCHTQPGYEQNNALYRLSTGHGGLYCEACHDSTHAIAASSQPLDGVKFMELQGHVGTLDTCTVCHATQPTGPGPHGIMAPQVANLTNYGISRGVLEGGNLQSLRLSDDDRLQVHTVAMGGGVAQGLLMNVVAISPVTTGKMDVRLEWSSDIAGTNAILYLFNFNQNTWVSQGQWPLGLNDYTVVAAMNNAAPYIRNSDGLVAVRLLSLGRTQTFPQGYSLRLDQVEISITPNN